MGFVAWNGRLDADASVGIDTERLSMEVAT